MWPEKSLLVASRLPPPLCIYTSIADTAHSPHSYRRLIGEVRSTRKTPLRRNVSPLGQVNCLEYKHVWLSIGHRIRAMDQPSLAWRKATTDSIAHLRSVLTHLEDQLRKVSRRKWFQWGNMQVAGAGLAGYDAQLLNGLAQLARCGHD